MAPASKVVVRLTEEQRDALDRLVRTGTHPAAAPAAGGHPAQGRRRRPGRLDRRARSPTHLETSRMTVMRVRQQFAAEGLDATLHRKKPTGRQYRKLDGQQEARLVALACSTAPDGHARWTMELLADRLVELEVVESIDPATVWRTLKKTTSSRGSSSSGSSRRRRARRSSRPWRTCSTSTPGRTTRSGRWCAWTRAASS